MKIWTLLSIACLLFVGGSAYAVEERDYEAEAQTEAKRMAELVKQGSYQAMAEATHPKILRAAGGVDAYLQLIEEKMASSRQNGLQIRDIQVGKPYQMHRVLEVIYVVMPKITLMDEQEELISSRSILIFYLSPLEESWRFAELTQENSELYETLFPILAENISFQHIGTGLRFD